MNTITQTLVLAAALLSGANAVADEAPGATWAHHAGAGARHGGA